MAIIHTVEYDDSDAMTLWRRTVDALIAKGESPADAIDGANLVLHAYERRRRGEDASPVSETKAPGGHPQTPGSSSDG